MRPFDYVICATKNIPDVPGTPIADLLRPAVTPGHTAILLLQNGLNIELPLARAFPENPILSGISMCGAAEASPGVIRHKLHDDLGVGPFDPLSVVAAERARDFVVRYAAGGRCTAWYDTDVAFSRWRKLLFNAVINPTCAVTGFDSGDMQLCPGLVEELVRPAMREIVAAAAAYGHKLTVDMMEAMITSDPIESHIPPSMLTDVRKVTPLDSYGGSRKQLTHVTGTIHRGGKPSWGAFESWRSPQRSYADSQEPLSPCAELSVEAQDETFQPLIEQANYPLLYYNTLQP